MARVGFGFFRVFLSAMALAFMGLLANVSAGTAADKAMIVLDASGSMWGQIDGEAKISIARRVLKDVLGGSDADLALGLMAYGHRQKGQCSDIEVVLAPKAGNGAAIAAAATKLNPLGKTPLSASVQQAAELLKYTEEKATVILVTDGIETCKADPCALGEALETAGIDFTAHVVGFGLSAVEGQQVACLAQATGGLYVQADDADALSEALTDRVAEIGEVAPEPEVSAPEAIAYPDVSLSTEGQVEIGRKFTVSWEGPEPFKRDVISLFDPDARQGEGLRITGRRVVNGDLDDGTVELVAPVQIGSYVVRYIYGVDREVLAETMIEVVDAAVSLDAPASVEIGRPFTVVWEGPGANRDSIQVFDPNGGVQGAAKKLREMRLVNGDYAGKSVTMQAPAEPGFYRLHYYNGDNREVIATREIEVLDAEVSLQADESVSIGATFDVAWVGPGANRDEVLLIDPSGGPKGKRVAAKRLVNGDYDAQSVGLVAPAEPGTYVLQYYNGDNRAILATREIEVVSAEVSLDAADNVEIGASFEVTWVGPGAKRDEVQLFDPQAGPKGTKVTSLRLLNGDYNNQTVSLVAPVKPGAYELRYYNGDNRAFLAARPIEVVAGEVSLSAPETVTIGAQVEIAWVGPGARRDAIEVFDPAAGPKGKVVRSARLTTGDYEGRTVSLIVPATPGDYQFRYYNGDYRTILATRDVRVADMDVSLDGPSSAKAGETVTVSWVGPGAARDAVQIFDPNSGSKGKALLSVRLPAGDYKGKTVDLRVPKVPGNYLLRYWNGDSRLSLFETPFVVE